jgi:membrane dipeptidase
MPMLVDSHCDLAWNILSFGRDYTLAAAETRLREAGGLPVQANEDTVIGWPDYQRGRVAVVFATLFAAPNRKREGYWDKLCYGTPDEAHRLYRAQLDTYHELVDSKPDHFRLIQTHSELDSHVKEWAEAADQEHPVGLVVLMEGAEGIRNVDELPDWHALGVRLIGLAWAGTRYSGGTRDPGPLTEEGRRLLAAMAEFGFVLDLSHMDERAALEALDLYEGPVAASHVNCMALLPDFPTNRHFRDPVLRRIIERDGIIGNMPVNPFLKSHWSQKTGSRREEVSLDDFAAHLDHVCQLAGDSLHSGIGSDFDGGFGLQSMPPEIDTVADLPKVAALMRRRGYSDQDTENILGRNWLRLLSTSLRG